MSACSSSGRALSQILAGIPVSPRWFEVRTHCACVYQATLLRLLKMQNGGRAWSFAFFSSLIFWLVGDRPFDSGELVFMASVRKRFIKLTLLVWVIISMSTVEANSQTRWQAQRVDTDASFRGLSVVGDVVWASGTGG